MSSLHVVFLHMASYCKDSNEMDPNQRTKQEPEIFLAGGWGCRGFVVVWVVGWPHCEPLVEPSADVG